MRMKTSRILPSSSNHQPGRDSTRLRPLYCPCFSFPREHEDIVDGVAAGKHQVEDFDFSYGLYVDGGRVACFAEGRIGFREWARRNGRLADIHSLDYRLDHDIDELLG